MKNEMCWWQIEEVGTELIKEIDLYKTYEVILIVVSFLLRILHT